LTARRKSSGQSLVTVSKFRARQIKSHIPIKAGKPEVRDHADI